VFPIFQKHPSQSKRTQQLKVLVDHYYRCHLHHRVAEFVLILCCYCVVYYMLRPFKIVGLWWIFLKDCIDDKMWDVSTLFFDVTLTVHYVCHEFQTSRGSRCQPLYS